MPEKMKRLTTLILLSAVLAAAGSCAKNQPIFPDNPGGKEVTPDPPTPPVKVVDYDKYAMGELALKAGVRLGVSFTYWEYRLNTAVQNILKRDFTAVTFGNEMKHDAIVQADGRYDFTSADEMAGWAKACGNDLFGHTLGWHSQQQRDFLNAVISKAVPNNDASLLQKNWNLEEGTLDGFVADGFKVISGLYDVFAGEYAARAVSDGASLQMDAAIEADKAYDVSFWAKTLDAEGSVKIVSGDGQEAETPVSMSWNKFSVTIPVKAAGEFSYRLVASKDVVIDNIRVIGADGSSPSASFRTGNDLGGELVNDAIGFVYRDWVYTMVEHFDVYGWDVVNETFSDWPVEFRNTQNTDVSKNFVWGHYFKSTKDWVDKAFAYATDALARSGKTAILYLNDYNLETIDAKRKAYCDYVKGNPQVTGVGTQMHLDMSTQDLKDKIVACLKDLTATGRMVRISELDIKCTDLAAQADLYKFIFQKYLEIVPSAQRGGITIWGINDKDSWVGENNAPLLYRGANYIRKPAYEALYLYLCEVAGMDPYKE